MNKNTKRLFAIYCAIVIMMMFTIPAFADDNPLDVVNNLGDFIFALIRSIGLILLGLGVVQLGLSLKSHDPQQRANGLLTLCGGLVIMFAREIIDLITG